MSLPFLLNLVIGLIFIYLILSLVASEIQEILATLLQWRAAHLRKSIEILLTKDCLPTQGNTGANTQYLECVRQKVNPSLSLPLGWDKANRDQQIEESTISLPSGQDKANLKQQTQESKGWFWPPLRRFLGWIVSGFAIMMGAPFWFELLGKIINVRNAGKPPETSIDRQGTNRSVSSNSIDPR
ncbi:hypothetical protein LC653_42320 [Nostoc sp. CHAB 5784]|uniref:hypothetical protein n=1 Tax=Nostoc mirabile TaxID=2907820 RepID=UPI001E629FF3|nr:hypothetical protein [Nostoc mirabile]MCC5670253.1 hypothetical protein [Nostoc mirabile CHAB5784]